MRQRSSPPLVELAHRLRALRESLGHMCEDHPEAQIRKTLEGMRRVLESLLTVLQDVEERLQHLERREPP